MNNQRILYFLISLLALTAYAIAQSSSKDEEIAKALSNFNNESIVFYGRVVDQSGNPIAGALVSGLVEVNDGVRRGVDKATAVSDGNGFFTINGYKGKALNIEVGKTNYLMTAANTRYLYSALWPAPERHHPDTNNPVVIKMWKRQGSEALFKIDQHYKFKYTDSSVYIDLLSAKIVTNGGHLKVDLKRSEGVVSLQTKKDWGVVVEALEGGLIRTDPLVARKTYAAPDAGYAQADSVIISTNLPSFWTSAVQRSYFLKLHNEKIYGKVDISLAINRSPDDFVSMRFEGVLNTNSSKNWEASAGK